MSNAGEALYECKVRCDQLRQENALLSASNETLRETNRILNKALEDARETIKTYQRIQG